MQNSKYFIVLICLVLGFANSNAQTLSLEEVLNNIKTNNPQLKMYDAEIQSMDVAASGAKSWMPPQVETGFFMTPYNTKLWKANEMGTGMGNYMVGVTQMIPNSSRLKAESNYMNAMSSVEVENKNYTISQLNALAKTNYYQWLVLNKKLKVAKDNLLLLDYMIKSMEIRYKYSMDKMSAHYKATARFSELENTILMMENEICQKRVTLNTLMARDKNAAFEINSSFKFIDVNGMQLDTASLSKSRSDVKAIEKTIALNQLKIESEKAKFLPEFGIKYDHMFAFGQQPQQFSLMGMITIPMPWSTKMNKANINSFKIKNESLNWQKQMILNEATGMISGMTNELSSLKKQYEIAEKTIIPTLRGSYDASVLAWQNNTGDLFDVLDAWEAVNMAQMESLNKLQAILTAKVEIERQLETN
ncbi:MAG: TolC family protein [Flavobacterium sp.]|nr:TolC family protein [Flavobacterium sp.]